MKNLLSPVLICAIALIYLFTFGVLFGSHLGIMGDLVHALDFTLKTKIINSMAVFGYACIAIGVWAMITKHALATFHLVIALTFWASLTYGFLAPDCVIFNFCGRTKDKEKPACVSSYDRQGVIVECE